MRAIKKPINDAESVYKDCINSIDDICLKKRLHCITELIVADAKDYDIKAQSMDLFLIQANNCKEENVVMGAVTKKELTNLYTQYMVGKKPARKIYDELLGKAPYGKCPFCGFGQATTLDHYLPKSKFPSLSVLPFNLIPACTDCNKVKHTKLADTAEKQVIHPYYDHQYFISEQWLFAEVEETNPVSIRFYVKPPENWTDILKQRAETHFNDFNLSKRFSVESAEELSILANRFNCLSMSDSDIGRHLDDTATTEFKSHRNSWKTAMYQALALFSKNSRASCVLSVPELLEYLQKKQGGTCHILAPPV